MRVGLRTTMGMGMWNRKRLGEVSEEREDRGRKGKPRRKDLPSLIWQTWIVLVVVMT